AAPDAAVGQRARRGAAAGAAAAAARRARGRGAGDLRPAGPGRRRPDPEPPGGGRAMIVVRGLSKRYGKFEAIRGLEFHVRHGEVFGFLGPNGAGKSTTMRIIAGLIQPTKGEVVVDGHDLQREPLAVKAITSFIPDRPFLYEKLTAFEMLELVGG